MKKLIALILSLLLLCSCVAEEEPVVEEPSEKRIEITESEDGKFGLRNEKGEIILEEIYDSIKILKSPVFCGFEAEITEGKKPAVEYDEYMTPYLSETENTKKLVLDESGKPIVDLFFEEYIIETAPDGGEELWLSGVADGTDYRFIGKNGEFKLDVEENPRSFGDENNFGYTINTYNYFWYAGCGFGISFGDKVIFEPVYESIIKVPFGDRILLYDGKFAAAGPECRIQKITDQDGNIISRVFNDINFTVFEDGTYIGVAYSIGDDCEVPLYEGEERLPKGYWFVDKNGKIISERFEELPFSVNGPDEIIETFDEKGEPIIIPVKDYVLKE